MKRIPMRRARKNRRRHQNMEIRDAYRTIYGYDEWAFELGVSGLTQGLIVVRKGERFDGDEVNHLWSLGRRPDVEENLISLSRDSHRFFHEHLQEGRVLCVMAKLLKAERRGERFNVAVLDMAAGKSVAGVIENYTIEPPKIREWQAECVQRLKELAKCS